MIKVIVFDYAGVVVESPMANWAKKTSHPDPEKLKGYKKLTDIWDKGLMPIDQMFEYLSMFTGITKDEIWEKLYGRYKPNQEILEIIKKLRRNYKIFLFSNFVSQILNHLLEINDLTRYFDEVIVSSDYGVKKPDPKFFDILVKKAGVSKDEIIFIDDLKENVKGGNEYGIKSFLYVSPQQLIKDLVENGINLTQQKKS